MEEYAKAELERLKAARTKELLRCQDRPAKCAQFVAVELCTCAAELEELRAAHIDDEGKSYKANLHGKSGVIGF